MLSTGFRRLNNWKIFLPVINRGPERSQQHDASNKKCFDTDQKKQNDTSDTNKELLKNIITDELLNYSPPHPFDEIPLVDDPEKVDFHPAEFIDRIGPPLPISFNLAAFVNDSETLTKLVQLGVDLSVMDQNPEKAKFVLKLDFERDVKRYIQFLHDLGVEEDMLGKVITKNPFLFKEDIENLEIRVNYLKSKKFTSDAIAWIITSNPFILSMSTKSVDTRLGFFQKQFSLTGDEVRQVVTKCSKLVSYNFEKFLEKIFIHKEVFGFTADEMKKILVMKPKIWMLGSRVLKERFDIVHNVMGIPHDRIVEFPGIFLKRTFILRERHTYLVHLNRNQYDPEKANFVSLIDIATTTDSAFCQKCAHTSVDRYNDFLKTL